MTNQSTTVGWTTRQERANRGTPTHWSFSVSIRVNCYMSGTIRITDCLQFKWYMSGTIRITDCLQFNWDMSGTIRITDCLQFNWDMSGTIRITDCLQFNWDMSGISESLSVFSLSGT